MTAELWVAVVVAMLGSSVGLIGTVATRRTASEDGRHARMMAEIDYLSDQLGVERVRIDVLASDVESCHAERDELAATVRRLEMSLGGAHPGGPS